MSKGMVPLCLGSIRGGKMVEEVDVALGRIAADAVKRPEIKKAREIVIKISITPELHDTLNVPMLEYSVKEAYPVHIEGKCVGVVSEGVITVQEREPVQTDVEVYANVEALKRAGAGE